jgi:hypothetical protein
MVLGTPRFTFMLVEVNANHEIVLDQGEATAINCYYGKPAEQYAEFGGMSKKIGDFLFTCPIPLVTSVPGPHRT